MSGVGPVSKNGEANRTASPTAAPYKFVEVTSPQAILIDYSPFVCTSGRPCAGCLEYYAYKSRVEAAAVAAKKMTSG